MNYSASQDKKEKKGNLLFYLMLYSVIQNYRYLQRYYILTEDYIYFYWTASRDWARNKEKEKERKKKLATARRRGNENKTASRRDNFSNRPRI